MEESSRWSWRESTRERTSQLSRRLAKSFRRPLAKRHFSTAYSGGTKDIEAFDEAAVLVSDLTGFTSGTRKHGIVHVASIIVRMRQLCYPVLHAHGALFVGTEGDNLIVVLPDAPKALHAAVGMRMAIHAHNARLSASRSHHAISLGGIGVHAGHGVVVERSSGAVRGAVASLAYYIGEEICVRGRVNTTPSSTSLTHRLASSRVPRAMCSQSDGRLLASEACVTQLAELDPEHGLQLRVVPPDELGDDDGGTRIHEVLPPLQQSSPSGDAATSKSEVPTDERDGAALPEAPLTSAEAEEKAAEATAGLELPAADDDRFLDATLLPLAQRHACADDDLTALDATIAQVRTTTNTVLSAPWSSLHHYKHTKHTILWPTFTLSHTRFLTPRIAATDRVHHPDVPNHRRR
jgi:class 3 adenylate cyclase